MTPQIPAGVRSRLLFELDLQKKRSFLDPVGMSEDLLWEAMERCDDVSVVSTNPDMLERAVDAGVKNTFVGPFQRLPPDRLYDRICIALPYGIRITDFVAHAIRFLAPGGKLVSLIDPDEGDLTFLNKFSPEIVFLDRGLFMGRSEGYQHILRVVKKQ